MSIKQRIRESLEGSPFLFQLARTAQTGVNGISRGVRSMARPGIVRRYLASHPVAKLQIGAGPNGHADWLNTDISASYSPGSMFMDAAAPFPLPDASFDYVFAEHMIEHIDYAQGAIMLQESFRVLKPGGRIRLATPDLLNLLALFSPQKSPIQERYIRWTTDHFIPDAAGYHETFVLNNAVRNWGHRFIYDEATLRGALERAGFRDVKRYEPGASDDPHLQGIERHGEEIRDEEINRFETMVLEARKP